MKTSDIRDKFVKFFESKGHVHLPSSSLVPHNDNTLLFTNAGMVQFKDNFTGKANPKNKRAVTIQKCVRAGGKHNDLENVGFTARHHTFFEMLGNFSFGDYFKEDAIKFAWEFLTETLSIPKEKLYVTAHHSDKESADLWHEKIGVPRDRIFFRGDKDNFWEMGEVGPCGPCSEIFFDHGKDFSDPNADTSECILDDEDRYVEVWNLVFMQYEKFKEDGEVKRKNLPKPSVDTGAGLERLAAVMQGNYNNFDTDGFQYIISKIESISNKKYSNHPQMMRVIADHARSCSMLLSDGVLPSNEGRGYVLRRIIRRAVRFLDQLGVKEVNFYNLVDPVFDTLNQMYPDTRNNQQFVEKYLKLEEESFRKTLSSGLKLLNKEIESLRENKKTTLSGSIVFNLYDTHGFPVDLTQMILEENSLSADIDGFNKEMEDQKKRSKADGDFSSSSQDLSSFYQVFENHGATKFLGYENLESESKLISKIDLNGKAALVFDETPFYAEGGGQLGDIGEIYFNNTLVGKVIDTRKPIDGLYIHIVEEVAQIEENQTYKLCVDKKNRDLTKYNHTATHLLQAALINVLGDHVKQAGSSVGPDRLRFDFTHPEQVKKEEIIQIERIINEKIQASLAVTPNSMKKDDAIKLGAMALFGEKYDDIVRVINIPDFSIELCGGTHVENTSEISFFKVLSESSLSTGVRRIEAVTNQAAFDLVEDKLRGLEKIEKELNSKGDKLFDRILKMKEEIALSNKEIKQLKDKLQSLSAKDMFNDIRELKDGTSFSLIEASEGDDIRKIGDLFMDKYPKGIVCVANKKGDKCMVLIKTFNGNSNYNCSEILKDLLAPLDGKGGGKPFMAQGSVAASSFSELKKSIDNVFLS